MYRLLSHHDQEVAKEQPNIPSLHACLSEPFNHLHLYTDFIRTLEQQWAVTDPIQSQSLRILLESLTTLQDHCRQRHDENFNTIRLLEWDWVLDFDKLQSHCRDDVQVFNTQNRQLGTPLHFSLLSSPRSYLYHGFIDVQIQSEALAVLAVLVTDALILAQPIGERDASHHKNWIVQTFLHSQLVTTVRDSSVIAWNGEVQHRLELCLSEAPTSFSIPYQYQRPVAPISLFLMPFTDDLPTWTDLLLGWVPHSQRGIDLTSPILRSARSSYLPGATSRACMSPRQGSARKHHSTANMPNLSMDTNAQISSSPIYPSSQQQSPSALGILTSQSHLLDSSRLSAISERKEFSAIDSFDAASMVAQASPLYITSPSRTPDLRPERMIPGATTEGTLPRQKIGRTDAPLDDAKTIIGNVPWEAHSSVIIGTSSS